MVNLYELNGLAGRSSVHKNFVSFFFSTDISIHSTAYRNDPLSYQVRGIRRRGRLRVNFRLRRRRLTPRTDGEIEKPAAATTASSPAILAAKAPSAERAEA